MTDMIIIEVSFSFKCALDCNQIKITVYAKSQSW